MSGLKNLYMELDDLQNSFYLKANDETYSNVVSIDFHLEHDEMIFKIVRLDSNGAEIEETFKVPHGKRENKLIFNALAWCG